MKIEQAVAAGGDINGDGFADVIIGDPTFNYGKGRIALFLGSPSGLANVPDSYFERTNSLSLGSAVQLIGDVNGDGFDDFYFSETVISKESTNQVGSFLAGNSDAEFKPFGNPTRGSFQAVGDLNGDGFGEIAAYVHHEDLVDVFVGSKSGPGTEPSWTLTAEQDGSHFGNVIASAGDVNGDGFGDLVIGAMKYNGVYRASGKAYLYLGAAEGLRTNAAWIAEYPLKPEVGVDDQQEQFFGFGITGAGDVDGDGFDDVAIGACFADRGDRNEGIAFLYKGSARGLEKEPSWVAEANHPHSLFGQSMTATDVNGDGFFDVIVGLPQISNGQQNEGAVAVYHGSRKGLGEFPAGVIESDHTHENLGTVIRRAGDLNGDGFGDVLLAGPGFERVTPGGGIERAGRIVVGYGSKQGLPFHHGLNLKKPLLISTEQQLQKYRESFGALVFWGPFAGVSLVVISGLIVVQSRLRKRINKLVEENRNLARLEERSRIARDIHDHLGADLTNVALQAKLALREQENRNALDRIVRTSTEALGNIDELIWVTDPRNDTLESVINQIGGTSSSLLSSAELKAVLDFPEAIPNRRVSAEWRHHLFSASRELVRNAVKHSGANQVRVAIRINESEFELEVQDDGRGFDPALRNGSRNGLKNIETRVAALNGTISHSREGKGATFRVKVPLQVNP